MKFTKATLNNLSPFDIVHLPFGDKNLNKLSVVLEISEEGILVEKLYKDKKQKQLYQVKSLRKVDIKGLNIKNLLENKL